MTSKPKAKIFRVKRRNPAGQEGAPAKPAPKAAAAPTPKPKPKQPVDTAVQEKAAALEAIQKEALTGRQLRMARRVAQKHGMKPESDLDAVRLLRAQGIDPFKRANMLELVVPKNQGDDQKTNPSAGTQLPQVTPSEPGQMPSTQTSPSENPMEQRMREISEIQRDITLRRRRKVIALMTRLAFFVFLPTILVGVYFFRFATPFYATESQFMIIQNEGSGSAGGLGSLLPAQYAASQDSIATQAYLQSKDAMLRLDEDAGFRAHFTDDSIDPVQRLSEDPSNEEAYRLYKKNVKISYDPTEGVIRMEVVAADPLVAAKFSERLLSYAEERANELSQKKREDAIRDSREIYESSVSKRRDAQENLIRLQVENGADPEAVIGAIRGQISNAEAVLLEKELELAALLDNARPNRAKVEGVEGDIRRLQEQLVKLNQKMNSATDGAESLAQQAVTLQLAQADLAAADANLQLARQGLQAARTEANRQVRYLTVAVRPVASEEPSYPRAFENTILAFLIFAGIYLMISLTASILREQITT